jgi:alanine dehydrogenase
MLIGVPKEIKNHEYRVGLTPAGARVLVASGHQVRVERSAGERIGFTDGLYVQAGATIAGGVEEVYACPMIVKVKEPQLPECAWMKPGQVLFAYLHLASEPAMAKALVERKIVGIAYETVMDAHGARPLLIPMSEIAGRLSVLYGAWALQMINGGNGTLLTGVPGVPPARVVVLGAGTVGTQATRIALGLGADVTVLDLDLERLRYLDDLFGAALKTCYSSATAIEEHVAQADVVIGSILIPGKRAPKILTRKMIQSMRRGAVLVDVAIDQGGCSETSHPTTHSHPLYVEEGVVHYCVTNMPAACARSSTLALTNATLPYVLRIADLGYKQALLDDAGLREGLQLCHGQVTHGVAEDLGFSFTSAQDALKRTG